MHIYRIPRRTMYIENIIETAYLFASRSHWWPKRTAVAVPITRSTRRGYYTLHTRETSELEREREREREIEARMGSSKQQSSG